MKRFIYICIVISFFFTYDFLQAQNLKDYLIAYWSFDDSTAADNSGNGFHGVLVNSPKPDIGIRGSCFRFKGKNKFIEINESKTLIGDYILVPRIPFEDYNEFTIMCWVNKEKFEYWGGTAYVFFGEIIDAWTGIYHAGKYPDPTSWVKFASGSVDDTDEPLKYDYTPQEDYQWKHYTLVYKEKFLSAYVDGKLIGTKYQPHLKLNNNAGISTHWWYYGGEHRMTAGFTGRIDEVKIFSKALNQEEIDDEFEICYSWLDYPDFSSIDGIVLNGSAKQDNNSILLSKTSFHNSGSMWHYFKLPVNRSFLTEFKFKYTNGDNTDADDGSAQGADGIAFVIHNQNLNTIGETGGGIGYSGISGAVAIEFDTYRNKSSDILDPSGNHVAVQVPDESGLTTSLHNQANSIALNDSLPELKENQEYLCRINYDYTEKNLKVYLDKIYPIDTLIIEVNEFDIPGIINTDEYAIMGFTSATGGAFANHYILGWNLCYPGLFHTEVKEEQLQDENDLTLIYPNPAKEVISIENVREIGIADQVFIYNALGMKVLEFDSSTINFTAGKLALDISTLNNGVYLIQIISGTKIITVNLVKN